MIFSGKNGVGADGKQKTLPGWISKRNRFLAGRNKGTGREQLNEFDRYVDQIIEIIEKKRKKQGEVKTDEQLEQERKDKYELRTSMLKRASKRQASEIDSAGDSTAAESVDESSRDLIVYEGSHPARSRKRANLDSAAIINNSNAVLERYFKLQEASAASREKYLQEELQLRKQEPEIQRRRFKQEEMTISGVVELRKRLDESEESAKRRNQEQNSRFDRLEDLLMKVFEEMVSN